MNNRNDINPNFCAAAVGAAYGHPKQAHPDTIKPGTVIHYRLDKIIEDYDKLGETRPGLVMAVWRDVEGRAKILDVAKITTNLSRCLGQEMHNSFPGYKEEFNRTRNKIDLGTLDFVQNTTDVVDEPSQSDPPIVVTRLMTDLLVRRAYALLWDPQKQIRGTKPDSSLIRDGFAFSNIHQEHISGNVWQPDILSNGANHKPKPERVQKAIDSIARFANHFSRQEYASGKQSWTFPPHKEWPNPIPDSRFMVHKHDTRASAVRNDLK